MSKLNEVNRNGSKGRTKKIAVLCRQALDAGADAQEILDAMVDTMGDVGDAFSRDEIFCPRMLIAASNELGLEVIEPQLALPVQEKSWVNRIIGTVEGDLHDIVKNLVAMMIQKLGF